MSVLVEMLVEALLPYLDLPFALFGHSMGAVLAFEVAHALAAGRYPIPQHLILSARRPPHIPRDSPDLHSLSDEAFVAEISRRYGGIPAELLHDRKTLALLLPALRADVKALETFWPPSRDPLGCPISAFGGADDRLTPRSHLEAWRSQTAGPFRLRVFPGDHFYIDSHRSELLGDLSITLAPLVAASVAQEAAE
jgi:surfactin synthase thioesterase subunit